MYKARHMPKKFFFNWANFIDLVTILPVFVQYLPGGDNKANNFLSEFAGLVRVLRAFRILKLYRLFNNQTLDPNGIISDENVEVRR